MTRAARTLLFLLLCAVPAVARAQPAQPPPPAEQPPAAPAPTEAELAQARTLFEQAEESFKNGSYDEAIAGYQESLRLSHFSVLELNIAQCFRLKGDGRQALAHYQAFLAAHPDHEFAPEARRHVEQLTAQIERDDRAAAASARDTEASQPTVIERVAPSSGNRNLRIAGIATGVVGLAAIGVGIKFGIDARRLSDDLSGTEGSWTEEQLDKVEEGKRAERTMILLVGLGAGAVVTGTVLYVIGRPEGTSSSSSNLAVTPTSGRGLAVTLGGRF